MTKYIGDIGKKLNSPKQMAQVTFSMVVFAILIGFVVGTVVWAVFLASSFLTSLLWSDGAGALRQALERAGVSSWWLPIAICTIGGLAIGFWTKYTKYAPEPLESVMAQVREVGGYTIEKPACSVIAFLLPLVFGGSVGPEAGLTGIIANACTRIGHALKRAGVRVMSVTDITISAALSAVFVTPVVGVAACASSEQDEAAPAHKSSHDKQAPTSSDPKNYEFKRSGKLVLYTAAALGAFAGIIFLSSISEGACGIPRFTGARAGIAEIMWLLPCLIVGYVGALLYHTSSYAFARLSKKMQKFTIIKPLVAGAILGVIATFLPFVLFPGEEQAFELMDGWQDIAGITLLLTGLVKCVATPLCLNFGWRGGNFFPCIFAGIAAGYGMAALSGAQPMFCVCVTCAMLISTIQRKPLMALSLLLLCFPVDALAQMGIACLIGSYVPLPSFLRATSNDEAKTATREQ